MVVTSWEKEVVNRLNAIASSGGAGSSLTWGAIVNGSISTTAKDILPADANRKAFLICNHSTTDKIKINIDADASGVSAIAFVHPEGTVTLSGGVEGRISAIAVSGAINYTVRAAS